MEDFQLEFFRCFFEPRLIIITVVDRNLYVYAEVDTSRLGGDIDECVSEQGSHQIANFLTAFSFFLVNDRRPLHRVYFFTRVYFFAYYFHLRVYERARKDGDKKTQR